MYQVSGSGVCSGLGVRERSRGDTECVGRLSGLASGLRELPGEAHARRGPESSFLTGLSYRLLRSWL